MTNEEYWKERFGLIESASNAYGQEVYNQIEPAFIQAQRNLQSAIEGWYSRIAVNNQVSLTEARKLLSAKELAEFKWDVHTYIKYGEENTINQAWLKQLENASAKYHIDRLEALKLQMQQNLEKAFGNELDNLDVMAQTTYMDNYYSSAYEIQKGLKVGWDVSKVDAKHLETLISKPWAVDGKNFSDRVWQSKTSMVNDLHNELVRTCVLGKSPDEAIKHMTKYVDGKFKNAKMQASRLVMTEQAFFSSAAKQDCFQELDVEEYEIVATLDSNTSTICQELDGKVFPMEDFEPGVTAPPFHVWCRSTTVPFFDDEWSRGERIARDEDGNAYYVPSDMKYSEWEEKFVDGGDKSGLTNLSEDTTIKSDIDFYSKSDAIKKLKDEYGISFEDSKKFPMDEKLLSSCVTWMDGFNERYLTFTNGIKHKLPVVSNQTASKMKGMVGSFSYYTDGRVSGMKLNGSYFSSYDRMSEYVESCISSKWTVANAQPHKTFVHEFGHYISHSIQGYVGKANWEREFINECIEEFKKQVPEYKNKTYIGLQDYLSKYGTSSVSECFAEAFAEFYGGKNPREFATIFGTKLDVILKGVE